MPNLITRAKAYLAHPPANFPEGVGLRAASSNQS